MKESSHFDLFYPLFIIVFFYLVMFLQRRAKTKQEEEKKKNTYPPLKKTLPKNVKPPPLATSARSVKPPARKRVDPITKKKKPRIVKLVRGLKSKKELVFLAEILKKR